MNKFIAFVLFMVTFTCATEVEYITVPGKVNPNVAATQTASDSVAAPETVSDSALSPESAPVQAAEPAPVQAAEPAPVQAAEPEQKVDLSKPVAEQQNNEIATNIEKPKKKANWLWVPIIAGASWTLLSVMEVAYFDDRAKQIYDDTNGEYMNESYYNEQHHQIKQKQKWRSIWGINAAAGAGVALLGLIPYLVINF